MIQDLTPRADARLATLDVGRFCSQREHRARQILRDLRARIGPVDAYSAKELDIVAWIGTCISARLKMARPLRLQAPGLTYHITARGNARMIIFKDDSDRRRFLLLLARAADWLGVTCHAYCLMNNHYHLVATTSRPNVSKVMKHVNGTYAQWWNARHDRLGHVFQGRFGAQIIQPESYFLAACRYIVLNPVRAGMVKRPDDWPWSSYRATAGLAARPALLRPELLLSHFGSRSPDLAIRRYREFVAANSDRTSVLPSTQPVLGCEAFIKRFEPWAAHASKEVPQRERRLTQLPLATLFRGAATRARRNAQIAEAYRHGYSMAEIARFLEVHYSTISKAIAGFADRVESTRS